MFLRSFPSKYVPIQLSAALKLEDDAAELYCSAQQRADQSHCSAGDAGSITANLADQDLIRRRDGRSGE